MRSSGEPIVEIRREGSGDPLPAGWVARPIRWNGEAMEVAYDPQQVQVLRAMARHMDLEGRRRIFRQAGWRQIGPDSEGVELWVADREHLAAGHLDRLAHGPGARPENPALGIP